MNRRGFLFGLTNLFFSGLIIGCGSERGTTSHSFIPSKDTEEIIIRNGTIYIDAERKVDSLLVRNGSVEKLNARIDDYPDAAEIDLKGAAVYPGFSDSHVHLLETGYFLNSGVNLSKAANADEIVKVLEEKVETVPEDGIVFGAGFSLRDYDKWSLQDLQKIDEVTGSRLTFLADKLGHNAIINTALITRAGLTPETEIPLGGKMGIEDGRLTGMLRESALTLPWNEFSKRFDTQDIKKGTLAMANKWASMGYTSIVDLMGGPGVSFMRPEVFYEIEQEGRLPLRVNYCYTIFNLSDVDKAAAYRGKDTDLVRFTGPKIFVDGAFAGGQAWTSWENQQGNHGLQEIYTDDTGGPELNLNLIVAKVEEYGMNMHYHAQGDLAINAVLDALEKVRSKKGTIKGIHTLIHLAYVTDEQIERIRSFNGQVVTTVQPGFWPVESDTSYYYGDRANQAYPIKKLFDSGISVGISTDFSVSPIEYSPALKVINVATTGGGDPAIHIPISMKEAITGLTVGSAKTTGKTDVGTLEIGKKADFVIIDKDIFFSEEGANVLATYVSGKASWKASGE
jgi:predicted amidohydrolase YtcJ